MSIPVNDTWTLTFDEEFNGNTINTDVWGTNWLGNEGAITKPINSEELGAYDPAQVSVSGGYLQLDAIRSPVTVNGKTYEYRSGIVQTHDSFNQTYGYFEARIFLDGENGEIFNWPAFWLDGENWPYDGELDVMEGLGGSAAYHFHSPDGGPGDHVDGDFTGWHIFGALWEPGKVSFYYDNQYVGEITSGITDSPQYIILNLGIGINSIISVPSEMLVDWVHAYSLDPDAVAVTPQANYEGPGGLLDAKVIFGTSGDDALFGGNSQDDIRGRAGHDQLTGRAEADMLRGGLGNDKLMGGAGADRLFGGQGADILRGGLDGDVFVFNSIESNSTGTGRDTIADFNRLEGDLISLKAIDADDSIAGNQAFHFIGGSKFSGDAGELRAVGRGGDIIVRGDVDGDGKADFSILVADMSMLKVADFIL